MRLLSSKYRELVFGFCISADGGEISDRILFIMSFPPDRLILSLRLKAAALFSAAYIIAKENFAVKYPLFLNEM